MLMEGKVGRLIAALFGTPQSLITDNLGALLVSKGMPDYLKSAIDGYVFWAATQAGVATVAALGTVATGFCLANSPGSGRVLVPLRRRVVPTTAPAGATTFGWALSHHASTPVTHTTPLKVRSALISDATQDLTSPLAGFADSSFTLPVAQIAEDWVPGSVVAASSIAPAIPDFEDKGCRLLLPGASLSSFSLTTIGTAAFGMTWLSLPLSVLG